MMPQWFEMEKFSSWNAEDSTQPRFQACQFAYNMTANGMCTTSDNFAIDPMLLGYHDVTATSSKHSGNSDERRLDQMTDLPPRLARALPRSHEDMRNPRLDRDDPTIFGTWTRSTRRGFSKYPDAGLIDRGGLEERVDDVAPQNHVPGSAVTNRFPEAHMEVDVSVQEGTKKQFTRYYRKRTSADAGLQSTNVEDKLGDTIGQSRRSTRVSTRTKPQPKYKDSDDEGERRVRKTSKLQLKIADGRAPRTGALGPMGEVRTRDDGRMEFRDVDNPMWSKTPTHG